MTWFVSGAAVAGLLSRLGIPREEVIGRAATDLLFHASGAGAIQSNVPIQRFQRDMQALSNHAIMHPQTTMELYGRVLCGLEPNTLIV